MSESHGVAKLRGFSDELEKIAIDPGVLGWAGHLGGQAMDHVRNMGWGDIALTLGGGKLLGNAMLLRHGRKTKAIRALSSAAAGLGRRVGSAGKPMVGRIAREAAGFVEPNIANAYEKGHAAGKKLLGQVPAGRTRLQRALEYGHTPVSQVARDVGERGSQMMQSLRSKLPRRTPPAVPLNIPPSSGLTP